VAGAAATIVAAEGQPAPLCSSNVVADHIEDLQYTLGEGPGIDAHEGGRPVAEPDLVSPRLVRWPALGPSATAAGAGALFAFPLRLGAIRLGALTLYQPGAGRLSDAQHGDALEMADIVLQVVLALQAEAPPGALASELETLSGARAEVHQAAGMVSVQLSVTVGEALVRLRARAWVDGRPLGALAADVVARRVRFDA